MEFIVNTDLKAAMPREIGFNYEELKSELADRLAYYKGVVVTEDTIKEGKADKATLRKLREAIETRRKEIKKQCMTPYAEFEAKVKELVAMIDEPIAIIDRQLSEFEAKRQEEKRQQVLEAYHQVFTHAGEQLFPFERIMNPKWLNSSTTMKSVQEDLQAIRKRISADMLALKTVPEQYREAAENIYSQTMDIEKAMEFVKQLQKNAEARREAEEARAQANVQEETKNSAETKNEANPAKNTENASGTRPETTETKIYTLRFELKMTREQAVALKAFFENNHIEYARI